MIGHTEILIIVAVIVLLFGATAIPKLARSIGRAKSELEKGIKEGREADKDPKAEKEEKDGKEEKK